MKEQTPMQELINWISSDCTPMDCVLKAKELFEKERNMVIDAWLNGYNTGCGVPKDPKTYFNNKYNAK